MPAATGSSVRPLQQSQRQAACNCDSIFIARAGISIFIEDISQAGGSSLSKLGGNDDGIMHSALDVDDVPVDTRV